MSITDNIEKDLNVYNLTFDLIYFDLDGHWKRLRAYNSQGRVMTTLAEAQEQLELYRRGREDWNLKIAQITEHTFVDIV